MRLLIRKETDNKQNDAKTKTDVSTKPDEAIEDKKMTKPAEPYKVIIKKYKKYFIWN